MITPFKLSCQSCGLSLEEAASFLKVRPEMAAAWWNGTEPTIDGILSDLHELYKSIDFAAETILDAMRDEADKTNEWPNEIRIEVAVNDQEAKKLGWPCVAAHAAVGRRLLEKMETAAIGHVLIVPVPK